MPVPGGGLSEWRAREGAGRTRPAQLQPRGRLRASVRQPRYRHNPVLHRGCGRDRGTRVVLGPVLLRRPVELLARVFPLGAFPAQQPALLICHVRKVRARYTNSADPTSEPVGGGEERKAGDEGRARGRGTGGWAGAQARRGAGRARGELVVRVLGDSLPRPPLCSVNSFASNLDAAAAAEETTPDREKVKRALAIVEQTTSVPSSQIFLKLMSDIDGSVLP